MNEYLFLDGAFEVSRVFLIKADTEEQAYDILCEKMGIKEDEKEQARKYHRGIEVKYDDNFFMADDF